MKYHYQRKRMENPGECDSRTFNIGGKAGSRLPMSLAATFESYLWGFKTEDKFIPSNFHSSAAQTPGL
jgi:hypothetical protein